MEVSNIFGHFYNSSLRRYIVLMGQLFNNVSVARQRGDETKYTKVPITYASKERFAAKMNKINSNTSEYDVAKVETILPRMNIHLVDMIYNQMFKTNVTNRRIKYSEEEGATSSAQFNPVPYKFMFELSIYTRHEDEMLQIVEQILPYFQPHFTCKIKELHTNDIVIERDIPITLQSLAMDEDVEGDRSTRRRLEWSLVFELDGWFYPPVNTLKGEIKTMYLDFEANVNELPNEGSFESVDHGIDPDDDEKIQTTRTSDIPIPVAPEPPGVRMLNDESVD